MPKVITDAERELTLNSIIEAGISLIRKKGLKHVTVDDIVTAVGIGKSSFYTYYPSKEELLYDVIKKTEKKMFETTLKMLESGEALHTKMEAVLDQVFLAPDSLILYVSPSDLEALMRKLPDHYSEYEMSKSASNFEMFASLLHIKITPQNYGTIAYLTDCLQSIVSNPCEYGEEGRKQALHILVRAIADYMLQEMEGGSHV